MKQTDKELLIKDLCGKLPYKTYVKTAKGIGYVYAVNNSQLVELSVANDSEYWSEVFNIDDIKPYLRPMSSMTEEEKEEFHKLKQFSVTVVMPNGVSLIKPTYIVDLEDDGDGLNYLYDWLNKKMFDYRGLISKNLAIEVTEENNPYKE